MPTSGFVPVASASLAVRTSPEPGSLIRAARKIIWSIDPSLSVDEVKPMAEILPAATARRRFQMLLAVAFGLAALVLALI